MTLPAQSKTGPCIRAAKFAITGTLAAVLWLSSLAVPTANADGVLPILKVGTSGDYPPFSRHLKTKAGGSSGAQTYEGFDIDVARAFCRYANYRLVLVPITWPHLLDGLASGFFDVAMSGITVRPERSIAGRFSVTVARTGAEALVAQKSEFHNKADLDNSNVRLVVNRGGHLEKVANSLFPNARIWSLPNNNAVFMATLDRSFDAVITDTIEGPAWVSASKARIVGPLTQDRKAYLISPERPELAQKLDTWLLESEADGSLAKIRNKWLSKDSPKSATVIQALAGAIDERLSLMPAVAKAKRQSSSDIEDTRREDTVVRLATSAAREAAARLGKRRSNDKLVTDLFKALIKVSKDVQTQATDSGAYKNVPSAKLESELRPSLIRIGDRIAALAVSLDKSVKRADLDKELGVVFERHGLKSGRKSAIVSALAGLAYR